MSIGTAKPSAEELQAVPHHFINSLSITEPYNVGKYETEAIALLKQLFEKNSIVIMAGGSGLYIDAVCKGFDELPEADAAIRRKIGTLLAGEGIEALQHLLKQLDPVYYGQVDRSNPQRLSRALEVCLSSGKPYSTLREGKAKERDFNVIRIGLNAPRALLYEGINRRVDEMMRQGLQEEVKALLPYRQMNALQTVGYKELFDYLDGKTSLQQATELIKQNTRRFAKRQLTWFRRDEAITWFGPGELPQIIDHINRQLTGLLK